MKDKTGVIILNYNSANDTKVCIQSIIQNTRNIYIYIVDNCSKRDDYSELKKAYKDCENITVIKNEINSGYSAGNNIGLRRAVADGCEYVMICNPDVQFENDVISYLKEDLNESVAIAAPRIFDLDNKDGQRIKHNYSFHYALFNKKPFCYFASYFHGKVSYSEYSPQRFFTFIGSPSGCCFLMRADVLENIRYLDDNVFLYCEEYILGKKLENLGLKCFYDPRSVVKHHEGTSTRQVGNLFVDFHMYASEYYVLNKYCRINNREKKLIRFLRLLNFALKSIVAYDFSYLTRIRKKFNEIDEGIYKISF